MSQATMIPTEGDEELSVRLPNKQGVGVEAGSSSRRGCVESLLLQTLYQLVIYGLNPWQRLNSIYDLHKTALTLTVYLLLKGKLFIFVFYNCVYSLEFVKMGFCIFSTSSLQIECALNYYF